MRGRENKDKQYIFVLGYQEAPCLRGHENCVMDPDYIRGDREAPCLRGRENVRHTDRDHDRSRGPLFEGDRELPVQMGSKGGFSRDPLSEGAREHEVCVRAGAALMQG